MNARGQTTVSTRRCTIPKRPIVSEVLSRLWHGVSLSDYGTEKRVAVIRFVITVLIVYPAMAISFFFLLLSEIASHYAT